MKGNADEDHDKSKVKSLAQLITSMHFNATSHDSNKAKDKYCIWYQALIGVHNILSNAQTNICWCSSIFTTKWFVRLLLKEWNPIFHHSIFLQMIGILHVNIFLPRTIHYQEKNQVHEHNLHCTMMYCALCVVQLYNTEEIRFILHKHTSSS